MKISDVIKEMPYLHPGGMPIDKKLDGSYSAAALKRDFIVVGNVDDVAIVLHNTNRFAIGIDPDQTTSEGRFLPTFKLDFKQTPVPPAHLNLPAETTLQVNSVVTAKHNQNRAIASTVYKTIVDAGYTIISDNTQFDPGAALWKKLASDPHYNVIVADVDHGPFKDEDGKAIKYDGTNIADSEIWSQGSDFSGTYRVFVLYKS